VSATTSENSLVVEVTHDGGATWTSRDVRASWTGLFSISCRHLVCNALVTASSKSYVVRTKNFGRRWAEVSLAAQANALACASIDSCVIVGQRGHDMAWFATSDDLQINVATLKYVPSPLLAVGCGRAVCTAVGVSTVLSFRP
jgi:photosystem II stability/assembly factor-like uncharacterized protein